jgi:hypothetical protein
VLTIPSDLQLERLVEDHVLGSGQRCFFVGVEDHLQGLITLHNIKSVDRDQRGGLTAAQVMTPVDSVFRVSSRR